MPSQAISAAVDQLTVPKNALGTIKASGVVSTTIPAIRLTISPRFISLVTSSCFLSSAVPSCFLLSTIRFPCASASSHDPSCTYPTAVAHTL